jgi:hypothetical protein
MLKHEREGKKVVSDVRVELTTVENHRFPHKLKALPLRQSELT